MEKYIIQKAQKITSALYLVTDLIKDNEVLKWEIREEGVTFVSNALTLNTNLPGEKEQINHLLMITAEKIITFLNIALVSSIISKMNASILIHEVEALRDFIKKNAQGIELPGYILSDNFFQTDTEPQSVPEVLKPSTTPQRTVSVGSQNKGKEDIKDKKSDRQESILGLLKKESNLTIKDFAKVITGCSEKTIQRELTSLVEKGIIKKQGERRWSTYSLS